MKEENYSSPWELYWSRHDLLSHRFTWHHQHLVERFLDLNGFIHSISTELEEERIDYAKCIYPLGFFEVEQPSRIRYIWVIFIFTIFERRARALCDLLRECDDKILVELKDFSGEFIEKLKLFLVKGAQVNIDKSHLWGEVRTLQKVRDCIIHCGGQTSESRDKKFLEELSEKGIGINISSRGFLQIEERFCDTMSRAILDFIREWLNISHSQTRSRLTERGKNQA